MTRKWHATLRHPKKHPHTKFGIPTSKNIGDMHWTRSGMDGHTDGLTDGRTVRLLYASQSSFGGIKIVDLDVKNQIKITNDVIKTSKNCISGTIGNCYGWVFGCGFESGHGLIGSSLSLFRLFKYSHL